MKNLTWQNPEQLFVAQVLINKVKSKCCGIKVQSTYQCFSDWSKTEMSKFWAFNDKLHKMTWNELYKSASKGKDKRGMAYTIMDRNLYKNMPFIKEISKDVTMFELRVDGEIRVHGFRSNSIFYLCLLDREHKISRK